jgi:hypothetical protein
MARKQPAKKSVSKTPPVKKPAPAMTTPVTPTPTPAPGTLPTPSPTPPPLTKKDQILALYKAGITEVADLAAITQSRTTYVASVLRDAGELKTYFDLYTSTAEPMNAYSKFFAGHLGFKDVETARASVEWINRLYEQFGIAGDRAGQHHALLMALTMFDRARWTNKMEEAAIFRDWLRLRLNEVV